MSELPINQVIAGDCRESVIRRFDSLIEALPIFNYIFRHGKTLTLAPTSKIPAMRSGVFLALPQLHNEFGVSSFDFEELIDCLHDVGCFEIARLIAEQGSPFHASRVFSIIRSAKQMYNELNRAFIDHPYLYSFMVLWIYHILDDPRFIGGFFDADVSFPINKASDICQISFFHLIHNTQMRGISINNFREVGYAG